MHFLLLLTCVSLILICASDLGLATIKLGHFQDIRKLHVHGGYYGTFCCTKVTMNVTLNTNINWFPMDLALQNGVFIPEQVNMDYALPVYGYVTPPLSVIVTVTNILFIVVFAKSGMSSPTHILLRWMAISDMLTVLIPSPCFVYIYLLGNYKEFVPYDLCVVWDYFTNFIPTITHTASIWLTVVLAFQRFLCVCFPLNVRIWFGKKRTYAAVVIVYILAISCSITRFLEKDVISVKLLSKGNPEAVMEGCMYKYHAWMIDSGIQYLQVYYWLRAIVVQIFSCITMAILNSIVICKIKAAEKRRKTLRSGAMTLPGSTTHESRESRVTTWLVCFIISSVLVVEMPTAVFFLIYACMLSFDVTVVPADMIDPLVILLNLFILVSYPVHFVLYSCMSTKFRKTLCAIVRPRCFSQRGMFDVKVGANPGGTSTENDSIDTHM